jgi:hypothetical protein
MLHIRFATWDELPDLATVGCTAFENDPIYLHFHPWRSLHPEDWRDSVLRTLKWRYAEAGSMVLVGEVRDERPGGQTEIAGYMTATARGADGKPLSTWLQEPCVWGHQAVTAEQRDEGTF